jgi:uncharacterized membrane protein
VNARSTIVLLGAALAVSIAVNLFAATAAWTVLADDDRRARPADGRDAARSRTRELFAGLDADTRAAVRRGLLEAGSRARPDFVEARELRREAIEIAAAEPYDANRVAALLDLSRAAEARARARLETDAVALLGTLEPEERAALAPILNFRGRGGRGGGGRSPGTEARPGPG